VKETRESEYKTYRYYVPHIVDELPHILPVISYVKDCLTALNVRYGFTHNEIFWDQSKQFYLIESNHRMAGNSLMEMYQNIYGYYPLSQYLDLLQGKAIQNIPIQRKGYSLGLDVFNFFIDGADQLHVEDIESFQKIIHFRQKQKTDPYFYRHYTRASSINACILLNNTSKAQLDKDIQTILSREADGSLFFKTTQ
jgi:biotin carboxylase